MYPELHSLERAPFLVAPQGGGMLMFNALFAYLFFHAFQRSSNMYAFLGVRGGQSYVSLLGRKLPNEDGTLSDEYAINEHTIALFHLYVASSLDPGVGTLRKKLEPPELFAPRACAVPGRAARPSLSLCGVGRLEGAGQHDHQFDYRFP